MGRMEGKNKKNGEGKREEIVDGGGLELEGDTESASFDHLRKCWFLGVFCSHHLQLPFHNGPLFCLKGN